MSVANIAFLILCMAGFVAFGVSLFAVSIYVNLQDRKERRPKAAPARLQRSSLKLTTGLSRHG